MSKRMRREVGNLLYGNTGWRTGGFKRQRVYGIGKTSSARYYRKAHKKAQTAGYRGDTTLSYRGNTFMPREFVTTLRFWGGAERLASAGGIQDVVFRANSPRDPYFDAGGEEAAGLDELMAIYAVFKVVASSIQIRVINLDTDDPVHICVYPSNSNSDNTGTSAFAEPLSKVGVVTAEQGYATLHNYSTTESILGRNWALDLGTTGTAGVDPTNGWYWHCVFKNQSGNALNLEYDVSIFYRVCFTQLNSVSQT